MWDGWHTAFLALSQALSGGFLSMYVTNAKSNATGLPVLPQPQCTAATGLVAASCDYTKIDFIWSTVGVTSRARLSIPASSPLWGQGSTFIIAVTAAYPNTDFVITPRVGDDGVTLSTSSPITDVAGPRDSTLYYRVLVNTNASVVTLQAFPYSGDVVVYVCADAAIDPKPNAQSFLAAQVKYSAQ